MSSFAIAVSAALATVRSLAGAQVTYARAADSVELTAVASERDVELVNDYGIAERVRVRDFLVQAADLVLANTIATPQRGDQISETIDAVIRTYEVMGPGRQPAWQWSDSAQTTMRIHTKLISEVAA